MGKRRGMLRGAGRDRRRDSRPDRVRGHRHHHGKSGRTTNSSRNTSSGTPTSWPSRSGSHEPQAPPGEITIGTGEPGTSAAGRPPPRGVGRRGPGSSTASGPPERASLIPSVIRGGHAAIGRRHWCPSAMAHAKPKAGARKRAGSGPAVARSTTLADPGAAGPIDGAALSAVRATRAYGASRAKTRRRRKAVATRQHRGRK